MWSRPERLLAPWWYSGVCKPLGMFAGIDPVMLKSVLWLEVDRFEINFLPLRLERLEIFHALPRSLPFGVARHRANC